MKVRSNRIESMPELMIIPMIDIIFFLLVFFMTSSLQMVHQKALPVQLPAASAARQEISKPLAVTLQADGRIGVGMEIVPIEQVGQAVKALLIEKDTPVILRADKTAEHGKVIAVMDALKNAGVQKLSIAAEGQGG